MRFYYCYLSKYIERINNINYWVYVYPFDEWTNTESNGQTQNQCMV